MNEERLRRIQAALREEKLDAWFLADFRGADPISLHILGLQGRPMVTRRWFYVIPAQGDPVRICHRIEPHSLDALSGSVVYYGRWQEWQQRLKEALAGKKRVACQYFPSGIVPALGRLDAGLAEFLRSLGVELVSSGDLVAQFEVTLAPEQEAGHRRAMQILEDTVEMAFKKVRKVLSGSGLITEYALQLEMMAHMRKAGLTTNAPPIVAVGPHAADPHYEPQPLTSSAIRPDEVLLLDLWAKETHDDSVYADITWCAWTGSAVPADVLEVFKIVASARDAGVAKALEVAKAPVCGLEVDRAARDVIEKAGYGAYFIHRTGHSIFTEDHADGANMDDYETHDTRRLLPMTLFSVEPGIYFPEKWGIRSEVNVLVKEGGAEVTGNRQTELPALLA
jgi:Xaa-Pro aminopeptidase